MLLKANPMTLAVVTSQQKINCVWWPRFILGFYYVLVSHIRYNKHTMSQTDLSYITQGYSKGGLLTVKGIHPSPPTTASLQ